jgi:predicted transcriptional regulator
MEQLAHALASHRRLAIIEVLLDRGTASQSELRELLGVPVTQRGTFSKDVGVLERSGLLRRDGESSTLALSDLTARLLQALAALDREVAAERARQSEESAQRLQAAALRTETKGIA